MYLNILIPEIIINSLNQIKSKKKLAAGHCLHFCIGACAFSSLSVSSSPRPWIDVFALPEKFNMALTESDLDLKVQEMFITF